MHDRSSGDPFDGLVRLAEAMTEGFVLTRRALIEAADPVVEYVNPAFERLPVSAYARGGVGTPSPIPCGSYPGLLALVGVAGLAGAGRCRGGREVVHDLARAPNVIDSQGEPGVHLVS